ncbi:MAG: competence protein ComEC [Thermodesulfobacteriota bacterium]|nr:competence protein ComEC [Thermodesulfobacteriota bacterium]
MSISTPRCDDQDNISPHPKVFGINHIIRLVGRRPAVFIAVFLGFGMLVGTYVLSISSTYLWLLVLACSLGILRALVIKSTLGVLCSVSATFFAAGIFFSAQEDRNGRDFEPPTDFTTIEAEIRNTLASGPDFRTFLLARGTYGPERITLPGYGRVIIRQDELDAVAGDRIAFRGRIRKPTNRGNPGEFNWELDCKTNGIRWLASLHSKTRIIIVSRGPRYNPSAIIFKIRENMSAFFDQNSGLFVPQGYEEDVKAILKGIVVGDTGEISPQLYRTFSNSGLVHALSASGVHIAIVAFLAICMAKVLSLTSPGLLLWVPFKKLSALLSIPAMIFYCLIVGARVPAIRATIMGVMIAISFLVERKWDSYNALACAAVMVLIVYPLSLFTPSFQLSFFAVMGILMVLGQGAHTTDSERMHDRKHLFVQGKSFWERFWGHAVAAVKSLRTVLLASLGAVLATAPFIWYFFHGFPVYTLFANLVTDFVMTGALGLGLLAGIASLFSPWIGSFMLIPADWCSFYVVKTAEIFSGLPGSVLRRAHPDFGQIITISVFALSFLLILRQPSRKHLKPLLLILFLSASILVVTDRLRTLQDDLVVYFLNVGKGDSVFVQPPGSRGLMVDGGVATEHFDAGRSIVVPFLYWAGVSGLDGIVLTHPDMDHMGGLLSVMGVIRTHRLLWNPVDSGSHFLQQVLAKAQERGAGVHAVSRQSPQMDFPPSIITFLNRSVARDEFGRKGYKTNDASVVFRLDHGETSFLFTGDLEVAGEQELLQSGVNLRADVLKVGHHGSKSSSSYQFLQAVRPRVAVISADFNRTGGLPHELVIERLEALGSKVFWTGRDGAVTVLSDGQSLRVQVGKTGEATSFTKASEHRP